MSSSSVDIVRSSLLKCGVHAALQARVFILSLAGYDAGGQAVV